MNTSLYLIGLIALSLVFAGCHAPDPVGNDGNDNDDDDTTDGDDGTGDDGGDDGDDGNNTQDIALTVVDPVTEATVGEPFTMTVAVTTTQPTTSIHSGFHWSFTSTADMEDLTPGNFSGGSPHVTNQTNFPGAYTIPEWTFGAEHVGTIYVRAHTQADGQDWWGDEFTIEVSASS